jgi:hypothetical protein
VPQTYRTLKFLVDSLDCTLFPQKRVFWIPVIRFETDFANTFSGPWRLGGEGELPYGAVGARNIIRLRPSTAFLSAQPPNHLHNTYRVALNFVI